MKMNVQAVNFNSKSDLNEYLEKKAEKLNQYYDKIIGLTVYLKLENSSEKQNKTSEMILEVPGDDIVVKKTGQSFEECIDLSIDTLKRLIIRKKEKENIYH